MTLTTNTNASVNIKDWIKAHIPPGHSGTAVGFEWLSDDANVPELTSVSPIDALPLSTVSGTSDAHVSEVLERASQAFERWRLVPAPKRAEFIGRFRALLVRDKSRLGDLVAIEMGKSKQEGDGEVQEMIDMADFAIGQSRMLYGKTMPSERPGHRLFEQWQPLGVVLVITAFNFPVAVWAWNAMLALIAGNAVVWKPSSQTPLCAIAIMQLLQEAWVGADDADVVSLIISPSRDGLNQMLQNKIFPLVSFTGSTAIGRQVNEVVSRRMGRCLLECGGNNAMIITPSASLDLAIPSVVFSAIGTAGQRCTSLRRLMIHRSIYSKVCDALQLAYQQIQVGNPLDQKNLMGPLVNQAAVLSFERAIQSATDLGGKLLCGGETISADGFYVSPTIIEAAHDWSLVQEETFAPILYVWPYDDFKTAIAWQNDVPQGLSSSLFSDNMLEIEYFLSATGSDCGIANINIGTSGAEIGGAFGGEKDTGGGREAGSDAWKAYMRRQTVTINGSSELPLAQGIEFDFT